MHRNLFKQIKKKIRSGILHKEGLWDKLKYVSEASLELAILRMSRRGQKLIPYSKQINVTKKVHCLIYANTIQITFLPQHPQTQTFSIIINFSIH